MSSWEGKFSFTVPLCTQMYKWEPVIIILEKRSITNLRSDRRDTGPGDDFDISPTASILVVLRINASYYGNQSKPAILKLGCPKKYKFVRALRKLKYCISQVIKAVVFERKSTPPLSDHWYTVPLFSLVTTMDLYWLKSSKGKIPIEKGKVF